MSYLPKLQEYVLSQNSTALNMLPAPDNQLSGMFARYLLQKAISVFEWTLPPLWNRDYFLYVLYCLGFEAIVNTDRFGVIPQQCGLMGYDVFYQPTNAIITNPLLTGMLQPRINRDCVVLKLMPDYGGVMDLVFHYSGLMAQAATAIGVNMANSKTAMVFFTDKKAVAEAFKKSYDAAANGQPMIVMGKGALNDEGLPAWETFTRDVKASYIAGDLISDLRKIEAEFDTRIGIPNANTDKRERLITDEVNANNVETYSMCALWLEQLQDGCRRAREMFGIDIDVHWREIATDRPTGGATNDTEGGDENAED